MTSRSLESNQISIVNFNLQYWNKIINEAKCHCHFMKKKKKLFLSYIETDK